MPIDPSNSVDEASIIRSVSESVRAALPLMPKWETWLRPVVSDAVEEMIAAGRLDLATAESFDDAGQFAQRVAEDLFEACRKAGIEFPDGPDD